MSAARPRIAYLDFMKGLCILLIVVFHTDVAFFGNVAPNLNYALQAFRVPMYYFLAGIFFKTYGSFKEFARRKVNNIIVPLVFFHLIACLIAALVVAVKQYKGLPSEVGFQWSFLLSPLYMRDWPYTYAMWFLFSLFWVNVVYFGLQSFLRNRWLIAAVVVMLSLAGYALFYYHVELPLQFDTALVGLPYFILGSSVKQVGALEPSKWDKWGPLTLIPAFVIIYLFSGRIDFHNQIVPNYLLLYLLPFIAILSLFWACKNLKRPVPVIGYWGRYSLIILGTHTVIVCHIRNVVQHYVQGVFAPTLVTVAILMTIESVLIWIFVKYFPRFTAQKPLFYEGWKLNPAEEQKS